MGFGANRLIVPWGSRCKRNCGVASRGFDQPTQQWTCKDGKQTSAHDDFKGRIGNEELRWRQTRRRNTTSMHASTCWRAPLGAKAKRRQKKRKIHWLERSSRRWWHWKTLVMHVILCICFIVKNRSSMKTSKGRNHQNLSLACKVLNCTNESWKIENVGNHLMARREELLWCSGLFKRGKHNGNLLCQTKEKKTMIAVFICDLNHCCELFLGIAIVLRDDAHSHRLMERLWGGKGIEVVHHNASWWACVLVERRHQDTRFYNWNRVPCI